MWLPSSCPPVLMASAIEGLVANQSTDSHHRRYGLMRGEHVEYRGGDSQIALAAEGQRHLLAVPRAAHPLGGRAGGVRDGVRGLRGAG